MIIPIELEVTVPGSPPKKACSISTWSDPVQAPLINTLRKQIVDEKYANGIQGYCNWGSVEMDIIIRITETSVKADIDNHVRGIFDAIQARPANKPNYNENVFEPTTHPDITVLLSDDMLVYDLHAIRTLAEKESYTVKISGEYNASL